MTLKGLITNGITITMIVTNLIACDARPYEIKDNALYKESVKIVEDAEKRMEKGELPSKQDEITFVNYYSQYDGMLIEEKGTVTERLLSQAVIGLFKKSKQYFEYSHHDYKEKKQAMLDFQMYLKSSKDLLKIK